MPDHTRIETKLSREMGLFTATMIGVGAMIGAGIFVLTGIAAGTAGPGFILAFILNGVVTLLTAMAYAELGSAFPEAGGGYLWVKEALPAPNGFLSGWMSWFAHAVACSLYALGFGAYFVEVMEVTGVSLFSSSPQFYKVAIAIIACLLFAYINYKGAKETGSAGAIITILKIIILGFFIIFGFYAIAKNPSWKANFKPIFPEGFGAIFMSMGLTFIAFEGYEIIAQSGEEIKNPMRNVPRAIFISLLIVVPIYILVGFVAIGGLSIEGMPVWKYLGIRKELAIVEAARSFMRGGDILILIGGLFSTLSALNATIYSSSRVAFAMGRDHNLPDLFGKISLKTKTPHNSIVISVALIILMAIALPIEDVASSADIMFLLLFLAVNMALINLRRNRPDLKRGFKVPFYPFIPITAIVSQLFLAVYMFNFSPRAWYTSIIWIILGIVIYSVYATEKEKEAVGTKVAYSEDEIVHKDYRILLPIAHEEDVKPLMTIAQHLAKMREGEITAISVVEVPQQLPIAAGRKFVDDKVDLLESVEQQRMFRDIPLHLMVRVAHSASQAIIETAEELKSDIMLLGWRGYTKSPEKILGSVIDPVLKDIPCNIALTKLWSSKEERKGPSKEHVLLRWLKVKIAEFTHTRKVEVFKKIFLPTAGGPHASFAAGIAADLCRSFDAELTVATVSLSNNGSADEKKQYSKIEDTLKNVDFTGVNVIRRIIKSDSVIRGLIEESKEHDLVIIGASNQSIFQQLRLGSIPVEVARGSPKPVLVVKKYEGPVKMWIRRFFGF
ncbi:MAG: amino acid permease [Fidelibacterota bacterium]